jgi:hypothetical protein
MSLCKKKNHVVFLKKRSIVLQRARSGGAQIRRRERSQDIQTMGGLGGHEMCYLINWCERDPEGHLDSFSLLATYYGKHHRTG